MAQARVHTADGYDRLAITIDMLEAMVAGGTIEDPTRVELLEGDLITMWPTHVPHARLTAKLLRYIGNHLTSGFEIFDGGSLRLNDYNEPMPDICIAKAGLTYQVLQPRDCALVIEVSDSTARKDRLLKAPLYGKAGIPELWIIDLNTSETIVHSGPTSTGWANSMAVPFSETLTPLFDRALSVTIENL
jgi:Uma2 family endonuclease